MNLVPILRIISQVKCYIGLGHEREEVARINVGGYFGETALLHDLPIKVRCVHRTPASTRITRKIRHRTPSEELPINIATISQPIWSGLKFSRSPSL